MKRYACIAACLVLFLSLSLWSASGKVGKTQDKFHTTCKPFNSAPKHHDHDTVCGPVGDAKSDKPGSQAQNKLKNNLCAKGSPVEISLTTLETLHQAVVANGKFKFGSDADLNKNASRKALASFDTVDAIGKKIKLGEGKKVSLIAFVMEAKHDDIPLLDPDFGGESVNCHDKTPEGNDIHVALVETSQEVANFEAARTANDKNKMKQIECRSVTAEIIPHFRPDTWNRFDSNPNTAPSPLIKGLPVQGLQVRLTGQLFFDGSHDPKGCKAPTRRSSWELHPVYTIEVKDGDKFISFDEWAENQH
jgi:hypothetical protein